MSSGKCIWRWRRYKMCKNSCSQISFIRWGILSHWETHQGCFDLLHQLINNAVATTTKKNQKFYMQTFPSNDSDLHVYKKLFPLNSLYLITKRHFLLCVFLSSESSNNLLWTSQSPVKFTQQTSPTSQVPDQWRMCAPLCIYIVFYSTSPLPLNYLIQSHISLHLCCINQQIFVIIHVSHILLFLPFPIRTEKLMWFTEYNLCVFLLGVTFKQQL